jgi:hypothetical protein
MNNFKDLLNIPEYWKSERFISLENFDNEEWRDIVGYEGLYQVSNYGRVKSCKFNKEKILRSSINRHGYLYIIVCKDGIVKNYRIHKLVALAFIPNPLNKKTINHKYGIKIDNRASELEWNTHRENNQHAWNSGFCERTRVVFGLYGKMNGIKYLSKKVYCPELDREFASASEAARQLNLNNKCISDCCRGEYKSAGKSMINGIETKLTWKYIS